MFKPSGFYMNYHDTEGGLLRLDGGMMDQMMEAVGTLMKKRVAGLKKLSEIVKEKKQWQVNQGSNPKNGEARLERGSYSCFKRHFKLRPDF
jgi:hypothetical protein